MQKDAGTFDTALDGSLEWERIYTLLAIPHKGNAVEQLRQQHRRLLIEYFPSYSPELNPDEGVWAQAKQQLANSCPHDVEELINGIERSINGIASSPEKLRACIMQAKLPSFLR